MLNVTTELQVQLTTANSLCVQARNFPLFMKLISTDIFTGVLTFSQKLRYGESCAG